MERFFTVFILGIREKLALFTGSLIAATILILSWITLRQQTEILTEGYEKQAVVSKRYISSLVIELDNLAQNLIRIEEFRSQILQQKRLLRKYQVQTVVTQDKKVNLLLFKTSLFGALGTKTVHHTYETYYSQYLNDSELRILELNTRQQLVGSMSGVLSAKDWEFLQKTAKRFISTWDIPELIQIRFELDSRIASLIIPARKKILEATGIDQRLFRFQTFSVTRLNPGGSVLPSFDTNLLSQESSLAKLATGEILDKNLQSAFIAVNASPDRDFAANAATLEWKGLDIQAFYSPLFEKPNSTNAARNMLRHPAAVSRYKGYTEMDEEIAAKIAILFPKIQARLKILRERKPPLPPYADADFKNLYADYTKLIQVRDAAVDAEISKHPPEPKDFKAVEALKSLRNFIWEDAILLRYKTDEGEFDRHGDSARDRIFFRKRWSLLRAWVSEAKTETAPEILKKLYDNAQIARSRSEAEELLWILDSKPLYPKGGPSLAVGVLQENLTGLMRTLVDRTEGLAQIRNNRWKVVIYALVIGLISVLLAVYISGIVVQKIKRIILSAEKVGGGNLAVEFEHAGSDEFGNLTVALNQMVSGLNEREKIKGILGSMIDPVVIAAAMKDLPALKRGSEKTVTAFFSDIASFSSISEKLNSPDLAELLNEYLSAMTEILKRHEGVLDKYIGDAIVGIFNSPVDVEDHTYKAVLASIEMLEKLTDLKKLWRETKKYIPEAWMMAFRVGLNTGVAKVGFMGTDALASYTMMGDTVNLAARLEAAAKDYGVGILVSDLVYEKIKDRIFTRMLDIVRVKGRENTVTLYEVLGRMGEESEETRKFVKHYELGMRLYLAQDWIAAIANFQLSGNTKASKLLGQRCEEYKINPPLPDWDGVFTRTNK